MKETSESGQSCYCQQSQAVRMVVKLVNLSAVKPDSPLNLHLEMTEEGHVSLCWSSPVLMPYPLQYEVKISASSGQKGWQVSQLCSLGFTMERGAGQWVSSRACNFSPPALSLGSGFGVLSSTAGLVELGLVCWFLLSWCDQ